MDLAEEFLYCYEVLDEDEYEDDEDDEEELYKFDPRYDIEEDLEDFEDFEDYEESFINQDLEDTCA